MSRRVLHFIDSGGLYGAESVILSLSRVMRGNGDFEPVIGCICSHPDEPSDLYDKALSLGLAAEKLVIRNHLLPLDLPRAAGRLRHLGIDLIHSHGYKPSVFGHLMRPLTGIVVTATCHLWFEEDHMPLKYRVMVRLERFFYRFFPAVFAVSDPIRDFLLRVGVREDRVRVINNGIHLDDYGPASAQARSALRAELGLADGAYVLLNVGRLTSQKAQDRIIDAVGRLAAEGVRTRLLIVGEGPLRPDLEARIAAGGLADDVSLLGFRADIGALLDLADLFVLPSVDEGMPIALLEAVASGTPVVVTPVGDIPRLIRDGETGTVVQPLDTEGLAAAVARCAEGRSPIREYAAAALAELRKSHSSDAMCRRYEKEYHRLLAD